MKKMRKFISLATFFSIVFMLLGGIVMSSLKSKAAVTIPTNADTAQEITVGKTYNKNWEVSKTGVREIWHKITVPSSGKLEVTVIHHGADDDWFNNKTSVIIRSDLDSSLLENHNYFASDNVAFSGTDRTLKCSGYLNQGTYWICMYSNYFVYNMNVSYEITTSFTPSNISFEESYTNRHNTPYSANSIKIGEKYTGQMSLNDIDDCYKFSVSKNCHVKLSANLDLNSDINSNRTTISIKEDEGYTDVNSFYLYEDEDLSEIFYLDAGTYYISVSEGTRTHYLYSVKLSNVNVGWITNKDGTRSYYDENGQIVKNKWVIGDDGEIRYVNASGIMVTNQFMCDGTYTYFLQADGSPMKDRLTYHPDGVHVIYFDEYGHEVFSDFAHVKRSIAGEPVDDYCFFDVNGYLYVDVVTYDKAGVELYYANPYGVLERGKWFQFSNTVMCADGTPWAGAAGGYGYANPDGTLVTNTWTRDWQGRTCYLQGNGVAQYP